MTAGYCHHQYADSFSAVGTARELSQCGGWLVERPIPDSTLRDGVGCYPLFDCQVWTGIPVDLADLADALVSVTLVANPFGEATEQELRQWFDVVVPYKRHYVTDLHARAAAIGGHHRRNIHHSVERVQVTTCTEPIARLDEWCALYQYLTERHAITGLRAFSREAFEKQLGTPGLVMFRAAAGDETVGLHLWYVRDDVAYGHLGATSATGYQLMASYALYWHAVQHLRDRVRWLDLGGVAGLSEGDAADGLRRFKAGWATGTRQAFLCGRVLQPAAYAALSAASGAGGTSYFPAYRWRELAPTRVQGLGVRTPQ